MSDTKSKWIYWFSLSVTDRLIDLIFLWETSSQSFIFVLEAPQTPTIQTAFTHCLFLFWWPVSHWERSHCNILSEQMYPNNSRGCIIEWSWKQMSLPSAGKEWQMFGWFWLTLMREGKRRRQKEKGNADCFSLLSSYLIELGTDHCFNAVTGMFFLSFFFRLASVFPIIWTWTGDGRTVTENHTGSTTSEQKGKWALAPIKNCLSLFLCLSPQSTFHYEFGGNSLFL